MTEFLIDPNGKSLDGLKQLEDEMIQSNDVVFKGKSNFEPQPHDDLLHQWISDAIFNKAL